jgi:hypothetical protein
MRLRIAGTAATATLAARIPPATAIDVIPLDPALEDAADALSSTVAQACLKIWLPAPLAQNPAAVPALE